MSRPLKTGLDYFPMDVDMDDKVELIEAKHGITGFGILIKLYQKLYKEGYFLKWTEETLLLTSKRINVDSNKVIEVINDCLKYQLFDETLYKKYSILTSPGIQKRYLQAIDRRKDIGLIKNYIIVDINGLNVNINWINVDNNTQSKVKKSKGKDNKEESKEKEIVYPFSSENFKEGWLKWKTFKKQQFNFTFKSHISEQSAVNRLAELSDNNEHVAVKIIEQSIANGWQGLFELNKSKEPKEDRSLWGNPFDRIAQ